MRLPVSPNPYQHLVLWIFINFGHSDGCVVHWFSVLLVRVLISMNFFENYLAVNTSTEYSHASFHPDILPLMYRPNRNVCKSIPKDMYKNVHSNTIYNSKTQQQPKYLSIAQWINKSWYIYTTGYNTAMRWNGLLLSTI